MNDEISQSPSRWGKRNGANMKQLKNIIIFGMLLIILTSCMEANPTKDKSNTDMSAIGDVVEFKDAVTYKIIDFNIEEGDNSNKAIITYEVTNIGKKEIIISNGMVGLIDSKDRVFEYEIFGSDPPGSLNPGIDGKGKVTFEIPKDAEGFVVTLRSDRFDFGGADYKYVKYE